MPEYACSIVFVPEGTPIVEEASSLDKAEAEVQHNLDQGVYVFPGQREIVQCARID